MTSENKSLNKNVNKTFFTFFPISVFFYVILSQYFPRNAYRSIKTEMLDNDSHSRVHNFETYKKTKLRKKILLDLKMHSTCINFNKKSITKLVVNIEGKIIGYRFCNLFYPNYFTKNQNHNLITDTNIFKKSVKLFLIIFKYN